MISTATLPGCPDILCAFPTSGRQVRLRLRSVGKARALLKAALPTLLEHAALNTQGEAWLTLAKCYLLEVSEARIDS